jgi:hypothetical protein
MKLLLVSKILFKFIIKNRFFCFNFLEAPFFPFTAAAKAANKPYCEIQEKYKPLKPVRIPRPDPWLDRKTFKHTKKF